MNDGPSESVHTSHDQGVAHNGELHSTSSALSVTFAEIWQAEQFLIIQQLVDDIVLVNDEQIIQAVLLLMERHKILVEGAGAVGVAALLDGTLQLKHKRVLVPLTGGNLDSNLLGRFTEYGLVNASRYFAFHVSMPDRPGELARMLNIIAGMRVNIIDVHYQRISSRKPFMQHEALITLETRNRSQCEEVLQSLRDAGYFVEEA